jgi:hypothetical protein
MLFYLDFAMLKEEKWACKLFVQALFMIKVVV